MLKDKIYFDNASTSHPKANSEIVEAISFYLNEIGSSPGRSGHALARMGDEVVSDTRNALAELFNIKRADKIAFTLNATHALNNAIKGSLKQGDHVIISNFEHNSVIRPLEKLKRQGVIEYDVFESDENGIFDLNKLNQLFKTNTSLIAINHASNVIGVMSPIEEIIKIAHEKDVKVLVDASQTAGLVDINVEELGVDILCFTGHKSLLGPSGTGGLYVKDYMSMNTLIEGGSGGNSFSLVHPGDMPDKFEAGTLNYLGIAGLGASIQALNEQGISNIKDHEMSLLQLLLNGLAVNDKVKIYGSLDISKKVPLVSFNIDGYMPNEVGKILNDEYGIMVRTGLQCAPLIHKTIGTFPHGTVRISLGWKSTENQVNTLIQAINIISNKVVV
jgi:cysteine desulfurase / selenocysteine lyase